MRIKANADDQKRQKMFKVRTGCVTCKTRRVKCDETRPTCMRCQKVNYKCGGYLPGKKHKASCGDKSLPLLVPKTHTPPTVPTQATFLSSNPPRRQFSNDQEFHYFQVFCDISAPRLGAYLDESLWTCIVLQASEQESFIRHAVIAIGALNTATSISTHPGAPQWNGNNASTSHFQFALEQYGKAIRGIREACQIEPRSKRLILIACLLAVCFEYSYGSNDCAVAHVKNGIRLIDDWFRKIRDRVSIDQKRFLPGIIEDELISIFSRLETDILVWHAAFEATAFAVHPDLEKTAMDVTRGVPTRGFNNLAAARKYLDIMLRQVDWFLCLVDDHLWAVAEDRIEADDYYATAFPWTNRHAYVNTYKKGLASWRTAFRSSLARCMKTGGKDFLLATAISLRQACGAIALSCCFGPEVSYDAYTAHFRAALSLAKTLSNATTSNEKAAATSKISTISSVLMRSLYFIATKCREKSIRTQALHILQSMHRREGIWDSRVASKVVEIVMRSEDPSGKGFILDSERLRAVKTSFYLHLGRGKVKYLTLENNVSGGWYRVHREDFSW